MAIMCHFSTFRVSILTSHICFSILTVFPRVDKETIKRWLVSGSIKKAYDRSVKGYVYITDLSSKL